MYDIPPYWVSAMDQMHAQIIDLLVHLRGHASEHLAEGRSPATAAVIIAHDIFGSDYTRETLSCLLGAALVERAEVDRTYWRGQS